MIVLRNESEQRIHFVTVVFEQGMPVKENFPFVRQKKSTHQHRQRGFSRTVQTDECDLFTGFDFE